MGDEGVGGIEMMGNEEKDCLFVQNCCWSFKISSVEEANMAGKEQRREPFWLG